MPTTPQALAAVAAAEYTGTPRGRTPRRLRRDRLGVLLWEDEEDPGVFYVIAEKGESAALLFYAGPRITGDPRELDLPIPVETLFDIATDPRVDVTTSQEALEAGDELSSWRD